MAKCVLEVLAAGSFPLHVPYKALKQILTGLRFSVTGRYGAPWSRYGAVRGRVGYRAERSPVQGGVVGAAGVAGPTWRYGAVRGGTADAARSSAGEGADGAVRSGLAVVSGGGTARAEKCGGAVRGTGAARTVRGSAGRLRGCVWRGTSRSRYGVVRGGAGVDEKGRAVRSGGMGRYAVHRYGAARRGEADGGHGML